jgi:hypothetical protein
VPDLRGAFRRGTGSHGSETMADGNAFAGPAVGSFEDDQMQTITGTIVESANNVGIRQSSGGGLSGAFVAGSATARFFDNQVSAGVEIDFDSSQSPNARAGEETRPFAAGVLTCIKI